MITLSIHDDFEVFKFPGGEVNVRLKQYDQSLDNEVKLIARINNSDDVMTLLLATDALRRKEVKNISLVLPYVPYARQDRVANGGEALSIKVFADLINSQNYTNVTIFDPHSDVTSALINNVRIVTQEDIVGSYFDFHQIYGIDINNYVILCPDAGAMKKTQKVAKRCGYTGVIIMCAKVRDTLTGNITATEIQVENEAQIKDKDLIIFDDICDGGRTFIEIAKIAKKYGAATVTLYVTHGIFSKGVDTVLEHINKILTTNSLNNICTFSHKVVDITHIEPFLKEVFWHPIYGQVDKKYEKHAV